MKKLNIFLLIIILLTSCSNNITEINTPKHDDFPDYSNRPWAYNCYIGNTEQAVYLRVQHRYMVKKLIISLPSNYNEYISAGYDYHADWQNCSWAISYQSTEIRDNYTVDIYYTHGLPLNDSNLDGSCYMELWYNNNDTTLSLNDRIEFIKIYRNKENKTNTTWTIKLDNIKNTNRIDINYSGPNYNY